MQARVKVRLVPCMGEVCEHFMKKGAKPCRQSSSDRGLICTREKGHEGPHHATGLSCLQVWA